MLLVSSVAVLVSLGLEGAIRSQREHSPLLRTIANEYHEAVGLTTALVTTGALIALAESAMGLVALPLFLFPLVLTQFAVRRYGHIRETYRQTIGALSCLTERAGYTRQDHASRVTSLAVAIGRDLGMSQREIIDLEYAALLHDLGQVALRDPIPGGATLMAAPADQQRIAHDGAEIVRRTGVLDNVAHILEAQTRPYRQVREFGEDLPMASRIIKVANAFDDLSGGELGGTARSAPWSASTSAWATSTTRGSSTRSPGRWTVDAAADAVRHGVAPGQTVALTGGRRAKARTRHTGT